MKLRFILLLIIPLFLLSSCTLRKSCMTSHNIKAPDTLKNKRIAVLPGSDHANDYFLVKEIQNILNKDKIFTLIPEKEIRKEIKDYHYINPISDIEKISKKPDKNTDLSSLKYLDNKISCDYYIVINSSNPLLEEIPNNSDTDNYYSIRIKSVIIKKESNKIISQSNCRYKQKSTFVDFFYNDNAQLKLLMEGIIKEIIKDIKDF